MAAQTRTPDPAEHPAEHPAVAAVRAQGPDERRDHVVAVLLDAFGPLIEDDPTAFRRRFRRMAASPWTFYRGSACLFYADVATEGVAEQDRWADERTSRVCVGYVVSEVSPYTADLDWDDVDEPDQAVALLRDLGRATAKVHCVADSSSETGDTSAVPFQVEEAVVAVLDRVGSDGDERFAADAVAFATGYAEVVRDDFRLFVDSFRNGAFPGL